MIVNRTYRDINGIELTINDYIIMVKKGGLVYGMVCKIRDHDIQVLQAKSLLNITTPYEPSTIMVCLNKTALTRTNKKVLKIFKEQIPRHIANEMDAMTR